MKFTWKYRVIAVFIALAMVITAMPYDRALATKAYPEVQELHELFGLSESLFMKLENGFSDNNPAEAEETEEAEPATDPEEAPDVDADETEAVPAEPSESEEPDESDAAETDPATTDEALTEEEATETDATEEEADGEEDVVDDPSIVGDNHDNLSDPSEASPTIVSVKPDTPFGSAKKMRMAANGLDPGEVVLQKTATPVEGMVNTWDIKLTVQAKDSQQTSDVVLVIDTSGSMRDYNRLTNAKAAARNFVNTILDPSNPSSQLTRIAIVSFADGAVVRQPLTNNRTALISAINGLTADGGTFTQGGVRQAAELLESSDADQKNIVLLSDGYPTYSYRLYNPRTYATRQFDSGLGVRYLETVSEIPMAAFNYSGTVGNGTSLRTYIDSSYSFPLTYYYYYNHGNSAIAEAGYAKSEYTLYSIAYSAGVTGTQILNQMASPGKSYNSTPDDIDEVLEQIAGEILSTVRNASVADPMGQGFVVEGAASDIVPSQGTATYDSAARTIDWTIGRMNKPANSDIKVATLQYRVTIDDEILNATPNALGEYPTNGDTKLTYTDNTGATKTMDFPVPRVNPVLLVIEKVLKDPQGNVITEGPDGRVFTVNVQGGSGETAYDRDYQVRAGQRRILTNLRWAVPYTVSETAVSGTGAGALGDYDITVAPDSFTLETGSTDDLDIVVTNREKVLGKLTVTKEFKNMPNTVSSLSLADERAQLFSLPLKFDFELTKPDGTTETFSLGAGESKVFANLPYGDYTVQETTTGFDTVYDPAGGAVTLSFTDREATVKVTNAVTSAPSVTATKVWVDGSLTVRPDAWFKLFRESETEPKAEVAGAEVKKVPTGDGDSFDVTWLNMPKYDPAGHEYTYSVQEVYEDGSNYVPAGYSKREEGLTVTNTLVPIDPTNITSLRFVKKWEGIPEGWNPTVTVEVYNKATDEVVRTAQLTYPDTVVEWKNLPYTDADGNRIDYGIREVNLPGGITPSVPVETESAIQTITYEPSQSSTDWTIKDPSFVITRTTKNGPFVIWTLNHLPASQREQFLQNVFDAAGPNPDQPIKALKSNWQTTPIIWIEGAQVTHDIFPDIPNVGLITVNIQFNDDGTIASANLQYEGQSTWTHFAVGTYSSKEIAITNTYDAGNISVHVEKVWLNTSNPPESVTIRLLADGVDTGKTLVLNAANDWKGSFTDLPEYNNGQKIVYTIAEVEVSGYETTYEQDGLNFTVTNKYIYIPPTGIHLDSLPYLLLLAAAGLGIGISVIRKRRRVDE